jgi:hypothetical protein
MSQQFGLGFAKRRDSSLSPTPFRGIYCVRFWETDSYYPSFHDIECPSQAAGSALLPPPTRITVFLEALEHGALAVIAPGANTLRKLFTQTHQTQVDILFNATTTEMTTPWCALQSADARKQAPGTKKKLHHRFRL